MKPFALIVLLSAAALCGCASVGTSSCSDGCCGSPKCYRCKLESKPVKKVVYCCKLVPYCEHQLPHLGDCSCCPKCKACPKFKTVLMKREIECGCDWECVPEEVPCCACPVAPPCAWSEPSE